MIWNYMCQFCYIDSMKRGRNEVSTIFWNVHLTFNILQQSLAKKYIDLPRTVLDFSYSLIYSKRLQKWSFYDHIINI